MGVVEAHGPGATKFPVGTRVTAPVWPKFGSGQGTWQQYITIPEDALVRAPHIVVSILCWTCADGFGPVMWLSRLWWPGSPPACDAAPAAEHYKYGTSSCQHDRGQLGTA